MTGYNVQVYIYDLTLGMARTLGPAIIGRPLDGLWHTAVVVYGREYFFGAAGIESCPPGTTPLGQPLSREDLGETEIPPDLFNDYLQTLALDRFKGEKYDLFLHNCNNFSHETAMFLTGRGIPQHILELPGEILSTPLGQMLGPLIQRMTPSGSSIPFTMGHAIERTGVPEVHPSFQGSLGSTEEPTPLFPVRVPILLDNPINVEKMMNKIREFNQIEPEHKLSESQLEAVASIAQGTSSLARENFHLVEQMLRWRPEHRFPALDLLREKTVRLRSEMVELAGLVSLLQENIHAGDLNAVLSTAALANLVARAEHYRLVEVEVLVEGLTSLLPSTNRKLEVYISTLVHNLSLHIDESVTPDESRLEKKIFLLSTILTNLSSTVQQVESEERLLVSLGNILHQGDQAVLDLAYSMDIHLFIRKVETRCDAGRLKELKAMLKISADGIELE